MNLGNFAQVYLYDHNEAMNLRQSNKWNDGLDRRILESLQNMMDRVSPYVATYHSMKEKMKDMLPETKMVIAETEGFDMRRYNKPRQYEPTVVFATMMVRHPQTEILQSGRRTQQQKVYRILTNVNMWTHWHIHCCSLVVRVVGTQN